jgi:hypothetical protein
MARSIVWPQVAPPAEAASPNPADGLDMGGLSAAFGPELSRRIGIRVTAAVAAADAPAPEAPLLLGSIPLSAEKAGLALVHLGCAPDAGAMLLERLFGARGADAATAGAADLLALPPGSASWAALCRTVATALSAALGAAGQAVSGSPQLSTRATPLPAGPSRLLALDVDGTACRLLLVPEAARPARPEPPAPDTAAFRRAARARVLDLELPVALRIAERRISLEQAGRLMVGDILPIEPLETLDVMAAGRRIARLPASRFVPPAREPGSGQ